MVVDGATVGAIGPGLCVFLGVARDDDATVADKLAEKVAGLRIIADDRGRMDRSVIDVGAQVLVVSQFTLYGDCSRSRRPSFTSAAPGDHAEPLYEEFIAAMRKRGVAVETGVFGAHMAVELVNDGPVTLWLET